MDCWERQKPGGRMGLWPSGSRSDQVKVAVGEIHGTRHDKPPASRSDN